MIPFVTGWVGENHLAAVPIALYGAVLLLTAIAYFILTRALIEHEGKESKLALAVRDDMKTKISIGLYAVAIPLALVSRWIAISIYVLVAIIWFIPDRRIENSADR